jgi:hypothetical protein
MSQVGLCLVDFKPSKISLETFPGPNQGQTAFATLRHNQTLIQIVDTTQQSSKIRPSSPPAMYPFISSRSPSQHAAGRTRLSAACTCGGSIPPTLCLPVTPPGTPLLCSPQSNISEYSPALMACPGALTGSSFTGAAEVLVRPRNNDWVLGSACQWDSARPIRS